MISIAFTAFLDPYGVYACKVSLYVVHDFVRNVES